MENPSSQSFFLRHQFLILRLHSLSGLVPVGAYMCIHLLTNASTLAGAKTFQDQVDMIHSLGPALPLVEWTFIFLPIIFHAAVGVVIIRSGLSNASTYQYQGNIRYTLQRATAWIALFFIFYHVFHLHGWFHNDWWTEHVAEPLHGHQFDPQRATSTLHAALLPLWAKLVYAVGMLSCVYHFANGLWTQGITWGLWTTPAAQRRANYFVATVGLLLAAVGIGALVGVSTTDVNTAKAVEAVREERREQEQAQLKAKLQQEAPGKTAANPAAAAPRGSSNQVSRNEDQP